MATSPLATILLDRPAVEYGSRDWKLFATTLVKVAEETGSEGPGLGAFLFHSNEQVTGVRVIRA